MMRFLLLFSRQGKLRLQKWFTPLTDREKKKVIRDMMMLVLARPPRSCNFVQWRDLKIVYKRYASLYFCAGLEDRDNELLSLEVLHRYVELLDKYFGNQSEEDVNEVQSAHAHTVLRKGVIKQSENTCVGGLRLCRSC
ncbi:AP-1 complex subunit sigma-3a isoform X2 [Siniperca chuatsi]|uniref:AP-1 complex subunit sigma-3a isoform X2 n=1 Tax=Siniperca chuatsi TaxID=119488 RepID=UPI001CE21763|nr:AP-1 complex subunit sigma-3a isoform X2 [Siniperca chuatsi]